MNFNWIGFLILLWTASCAGPAPDKEYLFLGHPYHWREPYRIDPRLEALDLGRFAGVWLGGDVCSRTTEQRATLAYLDGLFRLKAPECHWALGNHDLMYGHPEWIAEATGRPSFYVAPLDDLCVLVLNTNLMWHHEWGQPVEDCARKQEQLDLIRQVCDTLRYASHLVVLHHHALFNELKRSPAGDTLRPFNLNAIPVRTGCPPEETSFTAMAYPWFKQVQQRGIQVVMAGGDLGMNAKTFSYRTPEGIWLLGSGINNSLDKNYVPEYVTNLNPDSVLVFRHHAETRRLSWAFVRLGDMARNHLGPEGVAALPDSVRLLIERW